MNKIYKVIWSKVRNCYVAVSEIAKRNGKSCISVNCGGSANRGHVGVALALALSVTGGAVFTMPQVAMADDIVITSGSETINDATHAADDYYLNGSNITFTVTGDGEVNSISGNRDAAVSGNTVTIDGGTVNNAGNSWIEYPAGSGNWISNPTLAGGVSTSGAAIDNHVVIKNATIGGGYPTVYGGYSQTGNASKNSVTFESGNNQELYVYGGYSVTGVAGGDTAADGNIVTIKSGTVYFVAGGSSDKGSAKNNQVSVSGGTVGAEVYGGYVGGGTGEATNNKVDISGGTMGGPVYGGYSRSSGSVNNNTVNVKNESSGTSVYGGHGIGDVTENIVNFTDSTVSTSIFGGSSTSTTGNVEKNQVKVKGSKFNSMFGGDLAASSATGSVMNNEVTVDSSTGGYVCGGSANGPGANVSKNKVIITDSTITTYSSVPCVMGGHLDNTFKNTTGEVSGNEVIVKGNSVIKGRSSSTSGNISGGFSGSGTNNFTSSGDVTGNSVTISDNVMVEGRVYGGYITNGSSAANNNTVTVTGGTVTGPIYGGLVDGGTGAAGYNSVNISGGTLSSVYGGDSKGSGAVTGNSIIIENSDLSGSGKFIYGGHSKTGNVTENTVTISNSQSNAVYGGGSSDGEVTKNRVVINSSNIKAQIVGGESQKGNASENSVELNNGTFTNIWGGHSNLKDDIGNTVTIAGGTVEYNVLGGISSKGNAHENEVTIKDGTIKGSVCGGRAGGSANENTVNISGNTTVKTDIFGGYSTGDAYYDDRTGNTPSTADGNTINISGSPDLSTSDIYGGSAYTSTQNNTINILSPVTIKGLTGGIIQTTGTVAGNTLNVAAKNVKAEYIEGFQNMNFYLPKDIAKDDTMLTVNGGSATDVTGVTFGVAALSGVNLQKGDTVNLLVNSNGLTTDEDGLKTADSSKLADASFLAPNNLKTDKKYELSISKKDDTTIITTVEDVKEVTPDPEPEPEPEPKPEPTPTPEPKPEPKPDPSNRLKSPVETRMAVATMINAGSDLLAGQGMLNAQAAAGDKEAAGGFNSFAAVGLSKLRAMSGSHVDIKGIGLNLGFAREIANKQGKLLFGPIVEYGHGSYDSYQDNGIKADGKASYWGLGIIAKQTNNNGFYYEGSLRAGRTKSDYSSQLSEVSHADYDSSATYWAAHLGAGKLVDIGHDNTMDVYGKYFYSHTGSDSAMIRINGQDDAEMHFDSVNSHRLRVGARLIHALNEKNKIYGGLGYQYEFSGDARATYRGDSTPSPGVKGSSGLIELGWQVTPGKGPMAIDFGVTGWVGKQRGVTANLQACWTF